MGELTSSASFYWSIRPISPASAPVPLGVLVGRDCGLALSVRPTAEWIGRGNHSPYDRKVGLLVRTQDPAGRRRGSSGALAAKSSKTGAAPKERVDWVVWAARTSRSL